MAAAKIISRVQENQLMASRVVLKRCEEFQADIQQVPYFMVLVAQLTNVIAEIFQASKIKSASQSTRAITAKKNAQLRTLKESLDELGCQANLIAEEENIPAAKLQSEAVVKKIINNLSQEALFLAGTGFAEFMLTLSPKILAKYAITVEELTELKVLSEGLSSSKVNKEVAGDQKVIDNKSLGELFNKMKEIKLRMNISAKRFIKLSPAFYDAYVRAIASAITKPTKNTKTTDETTKTTDTKPKPKPRKGKNKNGTYKTPDTPPSPNADIPPTNDVKPPNSDNTDKNPPPTPPSPEPNL